MVLMQAATRLGTKPATRPITLDDRLALRGLAMDERLDQAAADHLIRTAHIDIPHVETGPPILPTQTSPYRTPIAQLLHQAQQQIAKPGGWSRDTAVEGSAMCPLFAIRTYADGPGQEGQARTMFLDAIRAEWPHTAGVPRWNAQQPGPANPIRMLGNAAREADRRGL
ncbi:hypothetical protein AB0M92_19010 [Streptomyces sp. NPDC051582]|uniref:DUF6197 family protein n=1 Tax=Streptomyces sp. NPDC051582 TaxID=3155167 RepID=UPI0034337DB8